MGNNGHKKSVKMFSVDIKCAVYEKQPRIIC